MRNMEKAAHHIGRNILGFSAGSVIGTLGGMIGLGGAEFRLPILVGGLKFVPLEAIILNKATSLVVIVAAFIFRMKSIPLKQLALHWDIVINLLIGSLIGAWWAAGHAISINRAWLERIIMILLVSLSGLMMWEAAFGLHSGNTSLLVLGVPRTIIGICVGLIIGMVAAFLGVAGGELIIPSVVLLYGLDVKLAGSISLMISLPTMMVSFFRYSRSIAFQVLKTERFIFLSLSAGSILGAALGSLLVGLVPGNILLGVLGILLLISAVGTFWHVNPKSRSK